MTRVVSPIGGRFTTVAPCPIRIHIEKSTLERNKIIQGVGF